MKPITDIPSEWRHFGASLAFTIVLPLVPLLIESWYENRITAQSLTLATAIYAATIGVSSKNVVLLAISLITFVIIQLPPGDYLESYIAELEAQGESIQGEKLDYLRQVYGLDRPWWQQYLVWACVGIYDGQSAWCGY